MRMIPLSGAALCLVALGFLLAHGNDRSLASSEGPGTSDAKAMSLVGRDVRVHFRLADDIPHPKNPNAKLSVMSGSVAQVDAHLLTLQMSEGGMSWIPLSSIAYIRPDEGPATRPAPVPK